MKPMASISGTSTGTLNDNTYWQADKRLLPRHLRTSDNSRSICHYKTAMRNAMKSQLSSREREYLQLFYENQMTKTQIGRIFGVGSSAVCKSIKSAEEKIRDYVELYMQIYKQLEKERFDDDEECNEVSGGQVNYAKYSIDHRRI